MTERELRNRNRELAALVVATQSDNKRLRAHLAENLVATEGLRAQYRKLVEELRV